MIWALLVAAFALRVAWHNVPRYSPADETSMLTLARLAASRGFRYRQHCESWLACPEQWTTPGPVRFGNVFLLAGLFRLTGRWTHRTMAWVSTVAGALQVLAVYGIATELGSGGLWAAALAAVSPLGLAMGRRALQDAAVSATALGACWALLAGHHASAALLLGFLLAQKETALLMFPAVAAVSWAAGRPAWWPLLAGVAAYVAVFAALTGGRVLLLWRFARAVSSVGPHPYSVGHQSGPLHRLPLDLFALAPVTLLLATQGGARHPAAVGSYLLLLVLGLVPATRNVRLALPADGLLRVVAATALASWSLPVALAALVAVVASELWIFRRVFLREGVYDPVTANLVSALGCAPR